MTTITPQVPCRHCTVPTNGGDVCTFCKTYTPPTTDPPVPPGAEPDQWVGGRREVYAQVGYVPTSRELLKCPAVALVAEQRANGHLGRIDIMLDVAVGQSDAGLNSSQARELAGLLTQAADLADQWAGVEVPTSSADLLASALTAVRAARGALEVVPGLTGDYLDVALDSLKAATEALR